MRSMNDFLTGFSICFMLALRFRPPRPSLVKERAASLSVSPGQHSLLVVMVAWPRYFFIVPTDSFPWPPYLCPRVAQAALRIRSLTHSIRQLFVDKIEGKP